MERGRERESDGAILMAAPGYMYSVGTSLRYRLPRSSLCGSAVYRRENVGVKHDCANRNKVIIIAIVAIIITGIIIILDHYY
jgi:hypothetical protein